jgi:hypothetical protein
MYGITAKYKSIIGFLTIKSLVSVAFLPHILVTGRVRTYFSTRNLGCKHGILRSVAIRLVWQTVLESYCAMHFRQKSFWHFANPAG